MPQPARVVWVAHFENGLTDAPVLLTDFRSADGTRFIADPPWLTDCNGYIFQFSTPESDLNATDCADTIASGAADTEGWGLLRQMAWALGVVAGSSSPTTNHAVTAYTDGSSGPLATDLQFGTDPSTPIHFSAAGRFVTVSVDAAEVNCETSTGPAAKDLHAPMQLQLYITNPDGTNPQPTFSPNTSIEPCTSPLAQIFPATATSTMPANPTPPGVPTTGNRPFTPRDIRAGTFPASGSVLFTGQDMGLRMYNIAGTGLGNDGAFDNVTVVDATPSLDKSFEPSVLSVGADSLLTFTITNTDDLAAKNGWSFTDTLPAGLVVAGEAGGNGATTCTHTTVTTAAGSDTIAVQGDIGDGIAYCTVSVEVTSQTHATYNNGPSQVSEVGLDPPGNATVHFGDNADVEIIKLGGPDPAVPGHSVTYRLHVENLGPDRANNVVVSDPVPAPLVFRSASAPCREAAGVITCDLGTMQSGESRDITLVMHVPSTATDGVVNTAHVSSTTPDPHLNNNTATVLLPLGPETDLQIVKQVSTSEVPAGGQIMYTLAVRNNGPGYATDVTVDDPLPRGLTLVSAHPSQGSCNHAARVICHLGPMARNAAAQILIVARVAQTADGVYHNTATVAGGQPDPVPGNNTSHAAVRVIPIRTHPLIPRGHVRTQDVRQSVLDVAITKHVDHTAARPGERLVYTLDVTNRSVVRAENVRVTDTTDVPVTVISAHPSQGSCTLGHPFICNLGAMGIRAHATIRVVATADHAGTLRNTATVTSHGLDANPANNIAHAVVHIGHHSHLVTPVSHQLELTKTAACCTLHTVGYDLDLRNLGSEPVVDVTLCDPLPAGLIYEHATHQGITKTGREACWHITSLPGHAERRFHLVVRLAAHARGLVTNCARATGAGTAPAARARAHAAAWPLAQSVASPLARPAAAPVHIRRRVAPTRACATINAGPFPALRPPPPLVTG